MRHYSVLAILFFFSNQTFCMANNKSTDLETIDYVVHEEKTTPQGIRFIVGTKKSIDVSPADIQTFKAIRRIQRFLEVKTVIPDHSDIGVEQGLLLEEAKDKSLALHSSFGKIVLPHTENERFLPYIIHGEKISSHEMLTIFKIYKLFDKDMPPSHQKVTSNSLDKDEENIARQKWLGLSQWYLEKQQELARFYNTYDISEEEKELFKNIRNIREIVHAAWNQKIVTDTYEVEIKAEPNWSEPEANVWPTQQGLVFVFFDENILPRFLLTKYGKIWLPGCSYSYIKKGPPSPYTFELQQKKQGDFINKKIETKFIQTHKASQGPHVHEFEILEVNGKKMPPYQPEEPQASLEFVGETDLKKEHLKHRWKLLAQLCRQDKQRY